MKYKYTRRQLREMVYAKSSFGITKMIDFEKYLLATKQEDKKECKHKAVWSAEDNKYYCFDCGINLPTPSPLEIEEIEEINKDKNITVNFATKRDLALAIMKTQLKTNSLIRNQKKLYQFIKEKL